VIFGLPTTKVSADSPDDIKPSSAIQKRSETWGRNPSRIRGFANPMIALLVVAMGLLAYEIWFVGYPHLLVSFHRSNPDLGFPLSRAFSPLVR
jgi:hypothetical protein